MRDNCCDTKTRDNCCDAKMRDNCCDTKMRDTVLSFSFSIDVFLLVVHLYNENEHTSVTEESEHRIIVYADFFGINHCFSLHARVEMKRQGRHCRR